MKVGDMKQIFEEAELGGLKLRNRLVRSATWEGIAAPDGGIDDVAYEIYDELARGGVGAIITGFTSVSGNDEYFGGMMRLHDDALIPQYARLVDVIHAQGVPVIAQLALGGFYYELPNGRSQRVEPDGMTPEEVRTVERWFVDAAVRAAAAGFDGVQIHAAHFFFNCLARGVFAHLAGGGYNLSPWEIARCHILRPCSPCSCGALRSCALKCCWNT